MSTLETTNLKNPSSASNNIVLNADGSVGGGLGDTLAAKLDSATVQNAQTGTTYTFVLADAGKLVTASNAAATTYTVPPQSSVAWVANSQLRVTNLNTGVVTFAAGAGVTVTNTAATLAQYQSATLIRTGADAWTVVPFSGGVSALTSSDVTVNSGSPVISTSGGFTIYEFKTVGAGQITLAKAGTADILVVGGGGSGGTDYQLGAYNAGGGGAGGHLYVTSAYLNQGALSIVVGAGGAASGTRYDSAGQNGNTSRLGQYYATGGGGGASYGGFPGLAGGSGGGGGQNGTNGGSGTSGLGNSGATPTGTTGGGGGGAGGAGGLPAGGVGVSNSITGAAVTRAAGGAGGSGGGGAGAANSGNGGKGSAGTSVGSAGGSGIVIIRVKT